MLALVALDEEGVDGRREGRIVELEREVFGARFAGVRLQPAPNSTPVAVTRKSGARSLSRSQGLMDALTLRVRVLMAPL
ncbi:hypothetical protein JL39_21945 [Rhizobium sp. YS-1r]|nr:hypothetical protein JL39_21945 [Rhizobium sp. YS-1r]